MDGCNPSSAPVRREKEMEIELLPSSSAPVCAHVPASTCAQQARGTEGGRRIGSCVCGTGMGGGGSVNKHCVCRACSKVNVFSMDVGQRAPSPPPSLPPLTPAPPPRHPSTQVMVCTPVLQSRLYSVRGVAVSPSCCVVSM